MKLPAIILFCLSLGLADLLGYEPPIGIPDPATSTIGGATPFGWEIDRPTPDWPASWKAGSPSETAGFYYIDKTAADATDSRNRFGHPGKPRLTPPNGSDLAESGTVGAFIYIHAGIYTPHDLRSTWRLHGKGSSENPIWLVGNANAKTRPQIQSHLHMGYGDASFFIIRDLHFSCARINERDFYGVIDLRPVVDGVTVNHILIQNCEFSGKAVRTAPGPIGIGGSSTDKESLDFNVESVVVQNCRIHSFGAPREANSEQCGIYKDYHSRWVWALDNTIYGVGADCIAGSHRANDTDQRSEWYFIGENHLANPDTTQISAGENGIDLKSTRYVIISKNYIRGPYGREQGWGIVVHSGANPVPVRDCWIIQNKIHHASAGIVSTSTNGARDIGIVGNVIFDIKSEYAVQSDPWNGPAIRHGRCQGNRNFIVGNACYDYESGIVLSGLIEDSFAYINGNILNRRSSESGYELKVPNVRQSPVKTDYNFWPDAARIFWKNRVYPLKSFKLVSRGESNGLSGDAPFKDPAKGDFSLNAVVPESVRSSGEQARSAFESLFGIRL